MTERPWLRELVSVAEQPKQRRRPLIYVYDLPAEFNSRMLQYRLNKVYMTLDAKAMYNNVQPCTLDFKLTLP